MQFFTAIDDRKAQKKLAAKTLQSQEAHFEDLKLEFKTVFRLEEIIE